MAGEIVAVLGLVPVCRRHHAQALTRNERFGDAGGGTSSGTLRDGEFSAGAWSAQPVPASPRPQGGQRPD